MAKLPPVFPFFPARVTVHLPSVPWATVALDPSPQRILPWPSVLQANAAPLDMMPRPAAMAATAIAFPRRMGIPLQRLYHRNGRDAGIGPVADANFLRQRRQLAIYSRALRQRGRVRRAGTWTAGDGRMSIESAAELLAHDGGAGGERLQFAE